jgi:hypothetical protein
LRGQREEVVGLRKNRRPRFQRRAKLRKVKAMMVERSGLLQKDGNKRAQGSD